MKSSVQSLLENTSPDKENEEKLNEVEAKGGEMTPSPSTPTASESDQITNENEAISGEVTRFAEYRLTLSDTATTASSESNSRLNRNTNIPRTSEYEVAHKYHIQSHINTATRTPVVIQAVPVRELFRSPTTTRKSTSEEIAEKEVKPVLLQPRFVH
ncbi:hypothetical protein OSTOST_05661 [Ostertagia ostertagi]